MGFSLFIWPQALFLALKIFGLVGWSWWWVLSPLIAFYGLYSFVGFLMFTAVVQWARQYRPDSKKPFSEFYEIAKDKEKNETHSDR